MSSAEVLQRAIQAARAGRKVEARDLLIQLVEDEPWNETAWIWLSGLVDSLEDRITACENVLTINPANEKVRAYLAQLHRQRLSLQASQNRAEAVRLFDRARAYAKRNEVDIALNLAMQAVEKDQSSEQAWLLIGSISPDIDQRIAALVKASELNPSNPKTSSALKQARYLKANPMSAAARLEETGKLDEALKIYRVQAGTAKTLKDFDRINKKIGRIEGQQELKIRFVAPASSIVRLAFGWPLLYLSLALVQMGLNPFKHPNFYFWLGLPLVSIGGYLLSLAEIHSHHVIWEKLFREHDGGSPLARAAISFTGWVLILVPHVLLMIDSLNRLNYFTIPPPPF